MLKLAVTKDKVMLRFGFIFSFFCIAGYQSIMGQTYPSFKITAFDTASKGYYFSAPVGRGDGTAGKGAFLILDKKGKVVYYKDLPDNTILYDFKIQPNGLMSFNLNKGIYYLMDSNFSIIDSVYCRNGYATDNYDMQILPNGHFLLLGTENIHMDLSAYPYFKNNGSPGSKNATVVCGIVQELDENKNVIFEWHGKDHFAFEDIDPYFLNNPASADWMHFNAIDLDDDGNFLVSSRHLNEITKVKRSDGSIIWRLGGKKSTFSFANDSQKFLGQHDIRRIKNGNITLFDNGRPGTPFHPASGKEYKLDLSSFKAELAWDYTENPDAFSLATGNVQRLPDGTSLVNYGVYSGGNLVFNVVNPLGKKVFEVVFDDSFLSYRSFNYPDLPWWLHRPKLTCSSSGGKVYLQTAKAYSRYKWSNGDTSQVIETKPGDTISVFVPAGNGGFISSVPYVISQHTDACGTTSVAPDPAHPTFFTYPNPANESLLVKFLLAEGINKKACIFDITGKCVQTCELKSLNGIFAVEITTLAKGMYVLNINGAIRKFIKD